MYEYINIVYISVCVSVYEYINIAYISVCVYKYINIKYEKNYIFLYDKSQILLVFSLWLYNRY